MSCCEGVSKWLSTLAKTGSAGVTTVTWSPTRSKVLSGMLVYNGIFNVDNKGNAPATRREAVWFLRDEPCRSRTSSTAEAK